MEQVMVYRTKDRKIFDTEKEARDHETALNYKEAYTDEPIDISGTDDDYVPFEVFEWWLKELGPQGRSQLVNFIAFIGNRQRELFGDDDNDTRDRMTSGFDIEISV